MTRNALPAAAAMLALTPTLLADQMVRETDRLLAEAAESPDYFAEAVAVHGPVAVIGSPLDDDAGADTGAAYVFNLDATGRWNEGMKLFPASGDAQERAGRAVAVTRTHVFVGAPWSNDGTAINAGAVYVYRYDPEGCPGAGCAPWVLQTTLRAPQPVIGLQFGAALAASGDLLVVGADNGWYDAQAWVFRLDDDGESWSVDGTLDPADAATSGHFGAAVAIHDGRIAVGAPEDGEGAVHVFRSADTGWIETAVLTAPGATGDARFGDTVAIGDGILLAGAPRDDAAGDSAGSAHVYRLTGAGWSHEASLSDEAVQANDQFGAAVALVGETALVGGTRLDGRTGGSGAVIAFDRGAGGAWTAGPMLAASDGSAGDHFGTALATDGKTVLASAPWDDGGRGVAYAMTLPDRATVRGGAEAATGGNPDVDGDGTVGPDDLIAVLADLGVCPDGAPCATDLDGDGVVAIGDVTTLLASWGAPRD
jgi:hypothetical protein